MIYAKKRGLLSRSPLMSGYIVADTTNPTGFRPQYTRLGTELSATAKLPNWKAAAGAKSAAANRAAAISNARQRVATMNAGMIDANARRVPYNPRLSGLGAVSPLDPSTTMQVGQNYVFHFSASGFGVTPDPSTVTSAVAGDTTNFLNVIAATESGGIQVSFTYSGDPTQNIGAMGLVMQNDIQNSLQGFLATITGTALGTANLTFYAATSAVVTGTPPVGTPNPGAPFSIANFFEGLGTGGAIAVVAGVGLLILLAR